MECPRKAERSRASVPRAAARDSLVGNMKRPAAAAVAATSAQPVLHPKRSRQGRAPDWPPQPDWSLLPGVEPPALLAGAAAEGPESDWRDALKGVANGCGFKPKAPAGTTVAKRQEAKWLLQQEAEVLKEVALARKAQREETWAKAREEREKAREDKEKAKARGNRKGNPPCDLNKAAQDGQEGSSAPGSEKTRAAQRVDFGSSTPEPEKATEPDAMRSPEIAKAGTKPKAPRAARQTNGCGRGSSDSKSGHVDTPGPDGLTLRDHAPGYFLTGTSSPTQTSWSSITTAATQRLSGSWTTTSWPLTV